jgi:hypothetical protein
LRKVEDSTSIGLEKGDLPNCITQSGAWDVCEKLRNHSTSQSC